MTLTRRRSLQIGAGLFSAVAVPGLAPARAQPAGDRYPSANGEIVVMPIKEASLILQIPGLVIYSDPAGGGQLFENRPAPALILICHEHVDHMDVSTLRDIVTADTRIVANPASAQKLPEELRSRTIALANGGTTTIGPVHVEAIPAYHTVPGYTQYHPQGRDNGYVLTVDGRRIYISGDTDATPEVRALKDIDIAFLAISRWTLTPERGASAVASFQPDFAYPYHYEAVRDRDAFASAVRAAGGRTKVIVSDWHAARSGIKSLFLQ